MSKAFVLEIAALRIGAPIDKAGMETACAKLKDSGLFSSITYRYGPGPKKGFALTLIVVDQSPLSDAAIDVPGVDEAEAWQWLAALCPSFRNKVPGDDAALQFLARKLEEHLGAKLNGQHLVARLESEIMPRRRTIISFQPETLPRLESMTFTGQHALSAQDLTVLLTKAVAGQGYSERHFREAVELNLRPAYEKLGMYRVRFPSFVVRKLTESTIKLTESTIGVDVAVEEGPQYTLGDVQFVGDPLPRDAMFQAANFKKGALANWDDIQHSIWAAERPVRRSGYMSASARPERIFHDDQRVLDLKIPFNLGPLFRFGKLTLTGLKPSQEEEARKKWKLQPGDPFDFDYGREFLADFVRTINGAPFKKYSVKTSTGDAPQTMNFELLFEPR